MKDFRNLKVWQKAHALTLSVYRITRGFPADERYGLTSPLRRAATSIASNLAEGCGRGTDADFARFAQMAMGSASEVEYHLLLAHDLEYLPSSHYQTFSDNVAEVKRMQATLVRRLTIDANR